MNAYKRPVSVLVVIHTPTLDVLLLERAAHPGFWQSVTGSQEEGESLLQTVQREVQEETGLTAPESAWLDWKQTNCYKIFKEWCDRYAPGVTHNTEHVFSLQVAEASEITLANEEHRAYCWLPWREAASRCFSPSNQEAILQLPERSTEY